MIGRKGERMVEQRVRSGLPGVVEGGEALLRSATLASWPEEHAGAIADANRFLEQRGLWSDGKRQF